MAPGSIFIILIFQYLIISFAFLLCFYFTLHLYHKNTKNIILSYLLDLTLVSGREGNDNPLSRWLRGVICLVQVRGTRAQPPTGLIPWFLKTEGNTYSTLLHHPFLFKEDQRKLKTQHIYVPIFSSLCLIYINFLDLSQFHDLFNGHGNFVCAQVTVFISKIMGTGVYMNLVSAYIHVVTISLVNV